ncbi:SDR family oxidoreductase, partial [Thiolapillus sp.]
MKTVGSIGNKKILIAGCGYVGRRLARALADEAVHGLVRSKESCAELTGLGIMPVQCDLGKPVGVSLPTADADIYYLLPPPKTGMVDSFLANFLQALERSGQPRRIVYLGTTGVYGDCKGEWVDESAPVNPKADRALRRLDAERQLRRWAQNQRRELVLLRVAGIYGPGKLPLQRLRSGKPMLAEKHAPWTNRIHVDDLLQVLQAAMARGGNGEIYNVSDGQPGNMADYFNQVADAADLPRPPVVDPQAAERMLSAGLRSYLAESRRIDNRKMLRELQVILRYPTLAQG